MGGSVSTGDNNDDLIDNLIKANYIRTPLIEKVFRSVDRAFYFSEEHKHLAYRDVAWQNGNLHLSAPCIYSEVLEHLKLELGQSFLNIGSGTGYLSTMAGLILGPYGINHGIEIHSNVVDFAYEKLELFKKTCNGIDVFEFCEPIFIVGNGLELNHDRRYDRIYCGAACPAIHHDHLKQLMKIGGVLVVPCEDDLLKIVRNSEDSWEICSVLPVSFSTLQSSSKETTKTISLPEIEPLSLQELCRTNIRFVIRTIAETENPELTQERKRKHSKKSIKRCNKKRFVIPIYENVTTTNAHGASVRYGRLNFGRLIFHNYSTATFRTFIRNLARDSNENKDNDNETSQINDEESRENSSFETSDLNESRSDDDDLDDNVEDNVKFYDDNESTNQSKDSSLNTESDDDKTKNAAIVSLTNDETSQESGIENNESENSCDISTENEDNENSSEKIEILNRLRKSVTKTKKGRSLVNNVMSSKKENVITASTSGEKHGGPTDDEGDDESAVDHPKKVLKLEKLDSGISEESDDGKISGSSGSSSSDSTFSEAMEVDSDDPDFTGSPFFKGVSSDDETDKEKSTQINDTISKKYRIELEKRIDTLPLPWSIKLYLNYERQFSFC